ncbi:MAG: hypothetical protein JXA96_05900 [Sedimentisphaerales bacterium]|nr:hypothetical protein [Sedimentisphaerales bacterium]
MIVSSKRPKNVAIFSFVASLLFFVVALLLGKWSGFYVISSAGWFLLYVALIWFVLSIQFYQRALAEQEKLDLSQLAGGEQSSTIFQAKIEHQDLFSVAQGRLKTLEKWFVPIFAAIIALYQLIIGSSALKMALSGNEESPTGHLFCSIIMAAIAFVSFLLSRYATGMSSQAEWKPLRAGGSAMLGASLICFALSIAFALAYLTSSLFIILDIITKVLPGLMILLGLEIALNLVMDIYRPRLHGQYSRTAFDSRILGVINEPGGILKSAADSLDYQFGFKVSQTWFYKLLEQAIVPLILFGVVTLYLLSCIVVIKPDEQAIVEFFGNPVNDSNDIRIIGPGLTLKWPWPIEKAYKYPVTRIAEIGIGYKESEVEKNELRPKLWGQKHYEEEYYLLVASDSEEEKTDSNDTSIPPVNLVIAAVPVQYRINDLYAFIYNHENPEQMLESICYRELTKYAASAKLETEEGLSEKESLLGKGRIEATNVLTQRIQDAADKEGLGVEIVFLGLQGVHPPVEVAADYQKVTGAIQEKQKLILDAEAEKISKLSTSTGSVQNAEKLRDIINEIAKNEQSNEPDTVIINELREKLDEAFQQTRGETYIKISNAKINAYQKTTSSEADAKRFAGQLKAYRAAPRIYMLEQQISTLEQSLQNIRKYVIMANEDGKQITVIDLQDKLDASGMFEVQEFLKDKSGQ